MCLHLRKVQHEHTRVDKTMIYQHIDPVKIDGIRMIDHNHLSLDACCWLFKMSATRFWQLFKIVWNQQRIYTFGRVSLSSRWMWSWCRWYWPKWKSIWVRNNSVICHISVWGLKESVYILKVEQKGIAEEETDGYGQIISTILYFLRGKYLKMGRSRSTKYHKFSILPSIALCTLEEVFEVFVDISDDLRLGKETFNALQMRARVS